MSLLAKKKSKPEEAISFPSRYRVIAADLSLKRPGFCELIMDTDKNNDVHVSGLRLTSVDNKNVTKPHGELLNDVLKAMAFFFPEENDPLPTFFVRETLAMHSTPLAVIGIAKMTGLMDWLVWRLHRSWFEVNPMTIKKILTGSGKADKDLVQKTLEQYLGEVSYACDDESDAAAVGVAWLIQQGQLKNLHEEEKET